MRTSTVAGINGDTNEFCGCLARQSITAALRSILDESIEMVREPSRDEASDIAFGFGRLLGSLCGRAYIHVPGDRLHVTKIRERMQAHGCVRSVRHLVGGRCPSSVS